MAYVPIMQLRKLALASFMASLIAVGSYIHVPIGPVPIVLQNLFVLLAGLLLGARWGLMSISVFVVVGACGIPVFAGGKGGLAVLAGPTGGYLYGYLLATPLVGWIANLQSRRVWLDILAVVLGSLVVYSLGVPWLKWVTGWPWEKACMLGLLPFIAGDVAKAVAAVLLARSLRPLLDRGAARRVYA